MEAKEAVDFLEKVTAGIQGTRQDHINIQVAINIVRELLKEKPKK